MFPFRFGYIQQMQQDHFGPPLPQQQQQQQGGPPGPAGPGGGPIRVHLQQPPQMRPMPYVVPPNSQSMRHMPTQGTPHFSPINMNQQAQFSGNVQPAPPRPPQMPGQSGPQQMPIPHIQTQNMPPQQIANHPMPIPQQNQQPPVSHHQQFVVPNPQPPQPVPQSAPQPPAQMQLNNLVLGSIMDKAKLDDLMAQINKNTVLEDNVKEALVEYADEFITSIIDKACRLIKNREVKKIEARDIEFILQNVYNMPVVPRAAVHIFGAPETVDLGKERHLPTEAHKQRLAMLKKQLKKI